MKILIDNGHGENTAGKRSPDGSFREYKYARKVADAVVRCLTCKGYDAELLVPEVKDISLSERCKRANKYGKDALLVSIHVDAAGNGTKWMNARGWSVFTTVGKTKADDLATKLHECATKYITGSATRKDITDGDPDFESNFYILRNTVMPAVLTENGFMDNKEDVEYMRSTEGFNAIVKTHVDGIINYIKSL